MSSKNVLSSSSSSVIASEAKQSSSSRHSGIDPESSSGAVDSYLNPNIDYGEMTDSRDGQVYKTVKIGNQIWMTENLNFAYTSVPYKYEDDASDSTSWCYDDDPANCTKYGRLYTWAAAMDSAGLISVANKTRVVAIASEDDETEQVYRLNLQFFPLSERLDRKEKLEGEEELEK